MQNTQLAEAKPLFSAPSGASALVQIESSRAVQEVQAALVIAKKFPRDQIAATERIKNACTRPTLANVAVYQYARGGSDITGPSIRLAEAIAQQWGNLTFGFTELEQVNGSSTCEAFCWDLETNTKRSVTFQVPHERHTKRGATRLTDPRDIYELVANNASRRVRACILATIPGDVVEAALEQCDETMRATADVSPKAQAAILASFEKFGVSKEQIEKRIQRKLDAIQPAQVVALRKIHSSLKDGMSQPSEWFEQVVAPANVAPAKQAEPQALPVAKDSNLREELVSKMDAAGLRWRQVYKAAHDGGLPVETDMALVAQSDDAIASILAAWPNLEPLAREVGHE